MPSGSVRSSCFSQVLLEPIQPSQSQSSATSDRVRVRRPDVRRVDSGFGSFSTVIASRSLRISFISALSRSLS
jgi:hypothetical protein